LAVTIFLFVATVTIHAETAYNFQENAERLYKRANEANQHTIPEMAYSEKVTYSGRNIFLVHGAHFNPLHIRNMAQVFEKENIEKNTAQWLFLIEGITANSTNYSNYAEIEYAAQSAQAWNIPAENIIPYYDAPQVLQELALAVGSEKAIFFLVMVGMQTGDITFTEGKGYDENQIRTTTVNYIKLCQDKNIPFEISKLNALFPITNEKYEKTADECWDIHMDIRNRIAAENLQKILQSYPKAVNILVYCGSDHAVIFRQTTAKN
jgi:hypothetical protein